MFFSVTPFYLNKKVRDMENPKFKENQQQTPSLKTLQKAVTKLTYVSETGKQFGQKGSERKVEDTSHIRDI